MQPSLAKRLRQSVRNLCKDDAVTPVIGTILVLAITVVGIAGVLMWGAPAIQRVQDQNAQLTMVGEFEDLRQSSNVLTVPDASRIPKVVMPSGALSIEEGTRFMVASNGDTGYVNCDFFVTGWSGDSVAVSSTGCKTLLVACGALGGGDACFEIHEVAGNTLVQQTVVDQGAGNYQVVGADFGEGNWLFRLTDGGLTSVDSYAEAWLLESKQIHWEVQGEGTYGVFLDGGAIFTQQETATFLQAQPGILESAFGTDEYILRLRTYDGGGESFVGQRSVDVFMGLVGNYVRNQDDVYQIRYGFEGNLAEAWCNTLINRDTPGTYAVDGACTDTTAWVTYTQPTAPFGFEFIHANILVDLLL